MVPHTGGCLKLQVVACILVATALRIPGVWGDLWLDEVWSLLNLQGIENVTAIFTLFDDNNHPLNSLWLWILTPAQPPWLYRALSLGASILSVPLLMLCAATVDRRLTVPAALLGSCNYLLILYGTEARGYSCMLVGTLLVTWGALRALRPPGSFSAILITGGTIIGAVSHGSFIFPWVGALCAVAWGAWRNSVPPEERDRSYTRKIPHLLRDIATLFGPGALVLGYVWWSFYRFLPAGTGPLVPRLQIAFDYFSVLVGGEQLSAANPAFSAWMAVLALFVCTVLVVEVILLVRSGRALGVMALGTVGAALLIGIVLVDPRVVFVRYFLSTVPLALLLLASFAVRIASRTRFSKAFVLLCCLWYLVGNGVQWLVLLSAGRGEARTAFKVIAASGASSIPFETDQDFRAGLLLRYFKQHDPELGRLVLVKKDAEAAICPQAALRSSQDRFEQFPSEVVTSCGTVLRRSVTFESAMLSGERLAVYR